MDDPRLREQSQAAPPLDEIARLMMERRARMGQEAKIQATLPAAPTQKLKGRVLRARARRQKLALP